MSAPPDRSRTPARRRRAARAALLARALALSAAALCTPAGPATARGRGVGLPPTFLWSWERADDLRFAAGRGVGVAPLVATLRLEGDRVRALGRRQPLALPRGAAVLPVVRIELGASPALSPPQRAELAARLVALAGALPGSRGLQVDFDAPRSARAFDRALLADVRRALPDSMWLSMTALASWCDGDRWLDGLAVDEIVPMLFRMGPAGAGERARVAARGAFAVPRCADALGLATDEPAWRDAAARRVYWFHPGPWSRAALERALAARRGPP